MYTDYPLISAAAFAVVGILLFAAAFAIFARLIPGNFWKQIVEERNVALAIVAGAASIGICAIIAAAVH